MRRRRKISTVAEIYFVKGGTMATGSFEGLLMELLMVIGRVVYSFDVNGYAG